MSSLTYNEIITSFKDLMLNDPMYQEFRSGYMSWYDICLRYDPTYDTKKPCDEEEEVESVDNESESESESDDDIVLTAFVRISGGKKKELPIPQTPTKPKHTVVEAPWAPMKTKRDEAIEDSGIRDSSAIRQDNGIRTIVTRNLPRDITKDELRRVFEKYGPVRDVHIPINADRSSPYYGTIRGFAMIEFLSSKDSASAYNGEYGTLMIRGKGISIDFAKGDRKRPEEMFQQQQQQQQEEQWTTVKH